MSNDTNSFKNLAQALKKKQTLPKQLKTGKKKSKAVYKKQYLALYDLTNIVRLVISYTGVITPFTPVLGQKNVALF